MKGIIVGVLLGSLAVAKNAQLQRKEIEAGRACEADAAAPNPGDVYDSAGDDFDGWDDYDEWGEGNARSDLSDNELTQLVEETPESDPLNSFYDPHESYRLNTYAYWKPITIPSEHANPALPPGFLPLNAPPHSLPDDFYHEEESRFLAMTEHAASMCPYIRRWRELNPLRPYPVGPDFATRHAPIKFVPGRGYEIDKELAELNAALRDSFKQNGAEEAKPTGTTELRAGTGTRSLKLLKWQVQVLIKAVMLVQKRRPRECSKLSDFVGPAAAKPAASSALMTDKTCFQEAIYELEMVEDVKIPVGLFNDHPEPADKVLFYGPLLTKLLQLRLSEGRPHPLPRKPKDAEKARPRQRRASSEIPAWAQLEAGERLMYLSGDEQAWPERYLFPYTAVSLPSNAG